MVVHVSVGHFNDGVLEPSNDLVELPNPLEVLRGTGGRYLNPSTSTFHLHVIVLGGELSFMVESSINIAMGTIRIGCVCVIVVFGGGGRAM